MIRCPFCLTVMEQADRHGTEFDWCPECRGVWLDRGELDALLEAGAITQAVSSIEKELPDD